MGTKNALKKQIQKTHTTCRRCGRTSFHIQKKVCSACGYPSARMRTYNWGKKMIRRKNEGTGRMQYMKTLPRKFKNGFREGVRRCPPPAPSAASPGGFSLPWRGVACCCCCAAAAVDGSYPQTVGRCTASAYGAGRCGSGGGARAPGCLVDAAAAAVMLPKWCRSAVHGAANRALLRTVLQRLHSLEDAGRGAARDARSSTLSGDRGCAAFRCRWKDVRLAGSLDGWSLAVALHLCVPIDYRSPLLSPCRAQTTAPSRKKGAAA